MSKPIKILFVASECAEGMVPYATSIINYVSQDSRFETYAIVVNSTTLTYKGKIKAPNVKYIQYPHNKIKRLLCKFYYAKLIKAIKDADSCFHPDYIHLLTGEFSIAPYIRLHKSDRRLCYTVHDLRPHEISTKKFSETIILRYIQWGNSSNLRSINNITTNSTSQYKQLLNSFPQKHIRFTQFPSLITESIVTGHEKVPELNGISDYILFFGRVDVYKGVDCLIKAYSESQYLQKHKLVIAGRGEISQLPSNLGIIHINRFIKDEELNDLFRKAIVTVYPYRSATMSGVLSVSFFFQKKTVLSDVPFFKEYECDCTYFFKASDTEDLKRSLTKALKDSCESGTPHNAYETFYAPDKLVDSLYNFYIS